VHDFSTSWRDGIAFNALVHSMAPDAIDMDAVRRMSSNKHRLDNAFTAAEKNLGIKPLLDAEGTLMLLISHAQYNTLSSVAWGC
jgi:hypothetical protein